MREFKIETDAESKRHQLEVRLLSWGMVLLCAMFSVLIFTLHVSGFVGPDPLSELLFVLTSVGSLIGAGVVSCREVLRYAERQMIFVLDEDRIVRRRQGFPDVTIRFSEMRYVGEELRWLIVKSTEPQRKIAVPNDVSGYEIIRAELARHHSLDSEERSKTATSLAGSALWLIATIITWCLLLSSHDKRIAIPAGLFAAISVVVGCVRLWRILDRPTRR